MARVVNYPEFAGRLVMTMIRTARRFLGTFLIMGNCKCFAVESLKDPGCSGPAVKAQGSRNLMKGLPHFAIDSRRRVRARTKIVLTMRQYGFVCCTAVRQSVEIA